jgi:UDP-3-O-[3-hydroxymyristoyl] glucosamine N-acyltransferase
MTTVTGVAPLSQAHPDQISFLSNPQYRRYLPSTKAGAVILSQDDAPACPVPVLLSEQPYVTYAQVARLFSPTGPRPQGIHPTASVDATAQVADSAWIGPHSTVEAEAVIGARVFVGPNCVVGQRSILETDTFLVAQVTICHNIQIGQRVLVHPGAVLGSDGFGLANDGQRWIKIPQLGGLKIGDDVEIGANTTIDRGALEDTVIAEGVKLDNQIQVGHNVRIGAHTVVAGCVGIAGSVIIGRHCRLGGGVGIAGHLQIADHVHISGMSLVTKSLTQAGYYSSGLRVETNRRWNKIGARLRQLDDLARRLIALEKKN